MSTEPAEGDAADRPSTGPTPAGLGPAEFAALRVGYGSNADRRLDPAALADGWYPLFADWLAAAVTAGVREPNAMVLATVGAGGTPSTRTVLCKTADPDGVVFYTTRDSRKGAQLRLHPVASVTFPWLAIERQVHLEGPCEPVPDEQTRRYWLQRPRGAQLAAWASEQSRPVAGAADLDRQLAEQVERFADTEEIPVPPRWGGYRLRPLRAEFWQGGKDRFHDRIEAVVAGEGWAVRRLQP